MSQDGKLLSSFQSISRDFRYRFNIPIEIGNLIQENLELATKWVVIYNPFDNRKEFYLTIFFVSLRKVIFECWDEFHKNLVQSDIYKNPNFRFFLPRGNIKAHNLIKDSKEWIVFKTYPKGYFQNRKKRKEFFEKIDWVIKKIDESSND